MLSIERLTRDSIRIELCVPLLSRFYSLNIIEFQDPKELRVAWFGENIETIL